MNLIYKIEFNSTNSYIKNIINNLIEKENILATCKQYNKFLAIIIDDSEEKIESFFKTLERSLPLSLFLSNAEVIDHLDPSLEELKESNIHQNIGLTNDRILDIYNNTNEYQEEVKQLLNGEIIEFKTSNGVKKLSLPSSKTREKLGSSNLLVINMNELSSLVEVSPYDISLLSTIERPLVKVKFKLLQNRDYEYALTNFIHAKLPDDEATYKLATTLRKYNVNFLIYNEDAIQEDIIASYVDGDNIIISGDKAIFPRYEYALEKSFVTSKEYFDNNGGVFKVTLANANKRIKPSLGAYLSYRSENSALLVNIPGNGIKEVIKIPNIVTDFNHCLEEICEIDENTQRLIENYKKKFPSYFFKNPKLDKTNGFESILNLIAHLLGMSDYKEFEDKSLEFNAKSGIQIDMKVIKVDDVNYLDYRRIVQSIMSYKMADVQDSMLAFSFFESLSEFVCDHINSINGELKAKDVILCGDVFANSVLLSKTKKSLKTFNVIIPKNNALDY